MLFIGFYLLILVVVGVGWLVVEFDSVGDMGVVVCIFGWLVVVYCDDELVFYWVGG